MSSDNETDEDDIESDKQFSVKRYDLTYNWFLQIYSKLICFDSLLEWRRWFGKKKDGGTEHRGKDVAVGIFQMVCVFKRNIFW